MPLEPRAEVLVALPAQARDRARPVEARAAVVAGVRIGQVHGHLQPGTGDFGLSVHGRGVLGGGNQQQRQQQSEHGHHSVPHREGNDGRTGGDRDVLASIELVGHR